MRKLLAILALSLFTSCGVHWQISTHNYDPIYDGDIITSNSIQVGVSNSTFSPFRPTTTFGLYSNNWVQCRYHGFHDLWRFDARYNPFFCRPSQSFLWSSHWHNPWRPWMGNAHWGWYNNYWYSGWNNPYWPSYQPGWRVDTRPRVYINNGRRGSSNITRTPTVNRPTDNRGRSNITRSYSRPEINTNVHTSTRPTRTRSLTPVNNTRPIRVEQNTRSNYNNRPRTTRPINNSTNNGRTQIKKREN